MFSQLKRTVTSEVSAKTSTKPSNKFRKRKGKEEVFAQNNYRIF